MLRYVNLTRHPAIITLNVQSIEGEQSKLKLGTTEVYETITVMVGYYDILVDGGRELHVPETVSASIIAVRCPP